VNLTEQQKDLAEQKQKQLSLEFVNTAIKNVEERTAKFQEFIGVMQALIDEFDPSTTVEGIKELKGLVEAGGLLVAAALPAAAEQQKAAAQPKPMMAVAEPKQPMAKAPASAAKPVMGAKAKAKQPATPSTAKASKAGTPAAKAPPSATTNCSSFLPVKFTLMLLVGLSGCITPEAYCITPSAHTWKSTLELPEPSTSSSRPMSDKKAEQLPPRLKRMSATE
jgi:hypothetical protein